jgi:hypothetical protein
MEGQRNVNMILEDYSVANRVVLHKARALAAMSLGRYGQDAPLSKRQTN